MTREDAIEILNTVLFFGKCDCPKKEIEECLKMAIKALEQEPRKGHWIKSEIKNATHCVCSECGEYWDITGDLFAFCPNCGAKMEKRLEEVEK